jgi:hypothetical protein
MIIGKNINGKIDDFDNISFSADGSVDTGLFLVVRDPIGIIFQ